MLERLVFLIDLPFGMLYVFFFFWHPVVSSCFSCEKEGLCSCFHWPARCIIYLGGCLIIIQLLLFSFLALFCCKLPSSVLRASPVVLFVVFIFNVVLLAFIATKLSSSTTEGMEFPIFEEE